MRRYVGSVLVACSLAVSVLAGCSSDDAAPSPDESAPLTTVPPSIVPLTTTTTIAGTPVSDAEIYAEVGLSPDQAACIEASGVDGAFEPTPGVGLLDALVLTAEDGTMVAIAPTVRTGAELEQAMLDALAADCAPPELLTKLAALDGQALDDAAIADDLPIRLFQRRTEGASETEIACLEAKFREAPVRLSSLAANPRLVESQCVPADRLAEWRRVALDRGLVTAGASDAERTCLIGNVADQVLLSVAVDAVGSGDTSSNPLGEAVPTCVSGQRLLQIALDAIAKGADFGAEPLRPDAAIPPAG